MHSFFKSLRVVKMHSACLYKTDQWNFCNSEDHSWKNYISNSFIHFECQLHSTPAYFNNKALIFVLSEMPFPKYTLDWFYVPWASLKIVSKSGSPLYCLSLSDTLKCLFAYLLYLFHHNNISFIWPRVYLFMAM